MDDRLTILPSETRARGRPAVGVAVDPRGTGFVLSRLPEEEESVLLRLSGPPGGVIGIEMRWVARGEAVRSGTDAGHAYVGGRKWPAVFWTSGESDARAGHVGLVVDADVAGLLVVASVGMARDAKDVLEHPWVKAVLASMRIVSADDEELHGLIARMDDRQQLAFRRELVEQAIACIEPLVPAVDDDYCACGVDGARRWLAEPTAKVARDVGDAATADAIDGGVRNHDYPALYWGPVYVVDTDSPRRAADNAASSAADAVKVRLAAGGIGWDEADEALMAEARADARRWQVGTARAILEGVTVEPFPRMARIEARVPYEQTKHVRTLSPPLTRVLMLELARGNLLERVEAGVWSACPLAVVLREPIDVEGVGRRLGLPGERVTLWRNDDAHYSLETGFQCHDTRHTIAGPNPPTR